MAVFMIVINFFSVYSWWIATAFVSNGWNNARTGQPFDIMDVMVTFQSLIYGMFTFTAIIGLIPAIMRARIVGKIVFDLIEREP
jgi:hypothetical protein